MKRTRRAIATAAVLVGLFPAALWAQEDGPSDAQMDFGTHFASLTLLSFAWSPAPAQMTGTQEWFRVWAATLEMDEEAEEAFLGQMQAVCGTGPGSPLGGIHVWCPTPDAIGDLLEAEEPPVAVVTEWDGESPTLRLGFQLTLIGSDPSRPNYDGPEGDPNTGHNRSWDFFDLNGDLTTGHNTYADGTFQFVVNEGVVVLDADKWTAFILSRADLAALAGLEVWANDEGWDFAPLPEDWGAFYLGSADYLAALRGAPEDDPAVEPAEEPQTESEPDPEVEPEPEASEETPTPSPEEGSSDDGGIPAAAVVAGATAAVAAAGTAIYAATRRRKSKCDELRDRSDAAQSAWEDASAEMNRARDVYADSLGSDTESAALAAQIEAEAAEAEAYRTFQRAWNLYQDCLSDQLDAPHTPPPGTETRPREPVPDAESSTPGMVAAAPTAAVSTSQEVEWRLQKDKYDNWREPVGHVHIEMDRASEAFEQWLEDHGEVEEQTPAWLRWISPPAALAWDAADSEVEATFSLDDAEGLRNRASLVPLLREGSTKHWVTMTITIPTQTVGRYCERKWVRPSGGSWTPTDETRLGESDEPIPAEPILVRDDYETAESLADALIWQLKKVKEMQEAAAQAQIDLRERCQGG